MMSSEWYLNPIGGYGLALGLAILLIVVLTLLGLPRHRLTPRRRMGLLTLRMAVVALAIFAMFRPTLVYTTSKPRASTLVVMVDRSRSMSVADSVGGQTRWEMLRAAFNDAVPALNTLSENVEVKLYAFDDALHALDFKARRTQLGDEPIGKQTAIGAALEDMLRREAGKRLAGVVLLSDGAQRAYAPRDLAPQGPARQLADLGFPLYTFAFGQARGMGQARDVALKEFSVNPTVYVKNELVARGLARLDGFGNQTVPVELLFEGADGKMHQVAKAEIKSGVSGQSIPVELTTIPETAGEYKVTLRVPKQSGELVTTNNELSTFVTVLKGGIKVLYLEGTLRVDQVYLRRSLDASQDIKVDFVRLDSRDAQQRPADLLEKLQPGKYDVIMIGDLDASQLTAEELTALADVVKKGAGLVMLGGFRSFGPGGYAETPLADLLPIEMDVRERQRPGEPIRKDVQLPGPLVMQPTRPLGERHYLMGIAEGDRTQAWAKLPPLEGANRLGKAKPNAQVLATTPDLQPLLVVGEAGGRVMAFAGDTTWRWWMEGFALQHKRFWRQAILWLARKDETADGAVWIKLDERRLERDARVQFVVGARSPQGEDLTDAKYQVEVTLPDGKKQRVHLVRQGDRMVGTFDTTQQSGDYTIAVTADDATAQHIGTAHSRFLVFEEDLELDNAAADPTLLASLSAMTRPVGGRSLAPEELPALLHQLAERPVDMEVEAQEKVTPWDTWPYFILFVGFLSAEWYLRKKWGLV